MLFNPHELYLSRKKASLQSILPYIRYIAQSGLLLVISLAVIVFIDQYFKLLKYTPEQFPYDIVLTFVIGLSFIYSPFRSWLKPADVIYLMPKQQAMQEYIRFCSRRGYLISLIITVVVVVLSFFILRAYDDEAKLYIILYSVVAKNVIYHISYNLSSLTNKALMYTMKSIIYFVSFLGVYFIFEYSVLVSYVMLSILLVIHYLYINKQLNQFFNWQQLIEDEQRKVHRTYRFLNLFVDVPHIQSVTKKRQYLAQFAHNIKFTRTNTFSFLHYLTFARSEVGGIYIRNLVVGCIIAFIMANTMLWDGYAAMFFAVMFMAMNAVQVSTLRQIHQHSVWQNIYPIPLTKQHKQMTSIEFRLLLVAAIIFTLLPTTPFMMVGNWQLVGQFAIAMLVIVLWRMLVIRSRVKKLIK